MFILSHPKRSSLRKPRSVSWKLPKVCQVRHKHQLAKPCDDKKRLGQTLPQFPETNKPKFTPAKPMDLWVYDGLRNDSLITLQKHCILKKDTRPEQQFCNTFDCIKFFGKLCYKGLKYLLMDEIPNNHATSMNETLKNLPPINWWTPDFPGAHLFS